MIAVHKISKELGFSKSTDFIQFVVNLGFDTKITALSKLEDSVANELKELVKSEQASSPPVKAALLQPAPELPKTDAPIEQPIEQTTPWRKVSMLELPDHVMQELHKRGLKHRWCTKEEWRAGNIRKKRMEGWSNPPDEIKAMADKFLNQTINDSKGHTSAVEVREMVLLVLPYQRVEARKQHYREKNNSSIAEISGKFNNKVDRTGFVARERIN